MRSFPPPSRPSTTNCIMNSRRRQFATWFAENEEALPLNERCIALGEDRHKFSQMRHRRLGIVVAFVDIDRSLISVDESLIRQYTVLGTRRGDHFAGQYLEIVETTKSDR